MSQLLAPTPQPLARSPKLLIVGLLDRQFGIVQSEFPTLTLEHFQAERIAQISSAMNRADHVLVITKFISHKAFDHIDRAKIAYFTGLEGLRQRLAQYAAEQVFSNVVPIRKEAEDISGPFCDYTPIRLAKPGDVLTFVRPSGVPAHAFVRDIQDALTNCRENHGVEASLEIGGGRATVSVTRAAHPVLEAASLLLGEDELSFRLPTIREQAETFWRDVYCESFRRLPYMPAAHHANAANVAVAGWLSLCGEMEN